MRLEVNDNEDAVSIHRGLLLTTREKQLAKARAEALNLRAQVEKVSAEAQLARQEAHELREHIIATSIKSPTTSFRSMAAVFTAFLMTAAVAKIAYVGYTRASVQQPSVVLPTTATAPSSEKPRSPRTVSLLTNRLPQAM